MNNECNERLYFLHYMKHTYFVVLAWKEIQDILIENNLINKEEFEKINHLIIWHDDSKVSKEEWLFYARKFNPTKNQDINKVELEFKEAVKHHKDNNLHHFESLKNYQGSDWKCYIIEMICDYIAMGWEFNNYIFEYYEANKEKIDLPVLYKNYLEEILKILKENCVKYIASPLTNKRMTYLYYK